MITETILIEADSEEAARAFAEGRFGGDLTRTVTVEDSSLNEGPNDVVLLQFGEGNADNIGPRVLPAVAEAIENAIIGLQPDTADMTVDNVRAALAMLHHIAEAIAEKATPGWRAARS